MMGIERRPQRLPQPEGRPAPALRFDVTCPGCAADVELRATGAPHHRQTSAIVDCSECSSSWQVTVRLDACGRHPKRKVTA
jgi:hypothetical protein